MTRTTLALLTGVLIGLCVGLLLGAAQAQAPETAIKTDGGVIVFLVEGQEKARLDASGLYINGDIGYAGASIDTVTYTPHAAASKAGTP